MDKIIVFSCNIFGVHVLVCALDLKKTFTTTQAFPSGEAAIIGHAGEMDKPGFEISAF
jgi:hypothetical protein